MNPVTEIANMVKPDSEENDRPRSPPKERDLNVKRVPMEVWKHAKVNSVLSGLPFRDYIIAVLKDSRPLPAVS